MKSSKTFINNIKHARTMIKYCPGDCIHLNKLIDMISRYPIETQYHCLKYKKDLEKGFKDRPIMLPECNKCEYCGGDKY